MVGNAEEWRKSEGREDEERRGMGFSGIYASTYFSLYLTQSMLI
jgi:hypothetical protein